MARIVASIVEQALSVSADPLAAELLARLRAEVAVTTPAKATRPFSRRAGRSLRDGYTVASFEPAHG